MAQIATQANPDAKADAWTLIQPQRGWRSLRLSELWASRDLLYYMALRDVQVRYKQTALGVIWAVLQPVLTMVVFTVFFGRLLGVGEHTGGAPYPIFVFSGQLPWLLFAASVTASSNSLVANGHMLRKVYFPRMILPLSALSAPAVDFAAAMSVLFVLMLVYGAAWSWSLLLLPLAVIAALLAALSLGLLLAALTVTYRDFRYVVPFVVQTLFFLTPVIYPTTIVPEAYRWLLWLNPVGGVIEAFRSIVLGTPINTASLACSMGVAAVMLSIGLVMFSRSERRFADIV